MLQINFIRQNTELVKQKLKVKHFADTSLVDTVLEIDEQVRKLKVESETLQAGLNAASKEIGMLMGKGEKKRQKPKSRKWCNSKLQQQTLAQQLADAEKITG